MSERFFDYPVESYDGMLSLRIIDSNDPYWFVIDKEGYSNDVFLVSDSEGSLFLYCSSRVSDADVEGDIAIAQEFAKAIKERKMFQDSRCAVAFEGRFGYLWSPRNSLKIGRVTLEALDDLVEQIEEYFKK